MGVEPDGKLPGRGEVGEAAADGQPVGDLPAEIVDQHRQRFFGKGLLEHLGGAEGAAGIADQGMRHGAVAARRAEPMGGGVGGVADEALAPSLAAAAPPTLAA